MNVNIKRFLPAIFVISLFILALFIRSNPDFFIPKDRGSFEYFRIAERFLSKGKYTEAIKYFSMAFDMSPENRTIRSGLVYAYSKYGVILVSSGKYDKAVEYLSKAYELIPNASTRQNLSLMYSKKAVSEASNGQWSLATEDFTNSREVAAESGNASRTLAASLFNDAVDEYKNGHKILAILCLKESLLAYEDGSAMKFLGDIYYKEAEYSKAHFYWSKAKALDPADMALAEKLKRLNKESALAARQESKDMGHFEVRYEKDIPVDAQDVSEALEDAYSSVGRDLEYFPSSKTVVYFYSQKNFKNIFRLPSVVRAFYDGNIRMPMPQGQLDKPSIKAYIRHEYTHAVVSAKTKNNCPVWFNEGIAVWQEFKQRDISMPHLLKNIPAEDISIDALDRAFTAGEKASSDGARDMRIYYLIAYSAVKYIVDNWGTGALNGILKKISEGQHVVNAIDDELLMSQKEFETKWSGYISEKKGA